MRQDGEYWLGETQLVLDGKDSQGYWKLQVRWWGVNSIEGRWDDVTREDTVYLITLMRLNPSFQGSVAGSNVGNQQFAVSAGSSSQPAHNHRNGHLSQNPYVVPIPQTGAFSARRGGDTPLIDLFDAKDLEELRA